jgi:hypothetical protein
MQKDNSVLVLGEDVGVDGGVFRVTEGHRPGLSALLGRLGADLRYAVPVHEGGRLALRRHAQRHGHGMAHGSCERLDAGGINQSPAQPIRPAGLQGGPAATCHRRRATTVSVQSRKALRSGCWRKWFSSRRKYSSVSRSAASACGVSSSSPRRSADSEKPRTKAV